MCAGRIARLVHGDAARGHGAEHLEDAANRDVRIDRVIRSSLHGESRTYDSGACLEGNDLMGQSLMATTETVEHVREGGGVDGAEAGAKDVGARRCHVANRAPV